MVESIKISDRVFTFVRKRAYKPVSVFKGQVEFLRLGPDKIIKKEILIHEKLFKLGFPFAQITSKGKYKNNSYFVEKSLGDRHFGQIFESDLRSGGKIRSENFSKYLKVTQLFARAQLKTDTETNIKSFAKGTNLYHIVRELPVLKNLFVEAFKIIVKRLNQFPYVQTHGDFSAFNMYPRGVIDIESFFIAPFGYDLISNICMPEFFPKDKKYEFFQKYWFSKKEKTQYMTIADKICLDNNLPKLSDFYPDFYLCRSIWTAARMQKYPKLQNWRYKQLEGALRSYLRLFRK